MSNKNKLLKCLIATLFVTSCGKQEINNVAIPASNIVSVPIEYDFGPISQSDIILDLQYWFFYSFNDTKSVASPKIIHKCGNNQGDWEHVSLKINTEMLPNGLVIHLMTALMIHITKNHIIKQIGILNPELFKFN